MNNNSVNGVIMRLNIGRSKNQKYYYVQKTVYIDGKEKSLIVEKLGSHTVLLKKLNGEDPLEWAKKYVDELNKKEQEEKAVDINICFSSGNSIA